MAINIFITGASGYLGGEVLYQLTHLTGDYQIRALARDEKKGGLIKAVGSNIEIVLGDLDDFDLIQAEARRADIVCHLASTKHETSSRAIVKGLQGRDRGGPGYWLQIGGASLLTSAQVKAGAFGEAGTRTYDDIEDVKEIHRIIRNAPARVVDNLVLDQDPLKVRTALLPGPIIYGKGRGPVNTRSIQGPAIAEYTIRNGESFQIGQGESSWSTIHVSDVGRLFAMLVEAAAQSRDDLWNENGLFFPENGNIKFGEFARLVSAAAREQGLTHSSHIRSLTAEELEPDIPHCGVILGTNAIIKSSRAQKFLQWRPEAPSLQDTIPEGVKLEAQRIKSP